MRFSWWFLQHYKKNISVSCYPVSRFFSLAKNIQKEMENLDKFVPPFSGLVLLVLDCCSSLQVLFNLCSVGSIETLQFLVEFHVSLVNVINVRVFIKRPATTVLLSLLHPKIKGLYITAVWINEIIEYMINKITTREVNWCVEDYYMYFCQTPTHPLYMYTQTHTQHKYDTILCIPCNVDSLGSLFWLTFQNYPWKGT